MAQDVGDQIHILGEGDQEVLDKVKLGEPGGREYGLSTVEGERGLLDGAVSYAKALADYQEENPTATDLSIKIGKAQDVSEPGKVEYRFDVVINEGVEMSHDDLTKHGQRIHELAQGNNVIAQVVTSRR